MQKADNAVFLKVDGVEMQADFTEVNLQNTNSGSETTKGANATTIERAAGLDDYKLTFKLGWDTTNAPTQITHLKAGQIVNVEYGIDGAVSGKPRHVQNFLIDSYDPGTVTVGKAPVIMSVSASGSGAPSVNMFAGGTFS